MPLWSILKKACQMTQNPTGKPSDLSGPKIRKVQIDNLMPGMFVVDIPEVNHGHPETYNVEGYILSQKDVDRIKSNGFTEAFVDYSRNKASVEAAGAEDCIIKSFTDLPQAVTAATFKIPFEEEFKHAPGIFVDAVGETKRIFNALRSGTEKLDLGAVEKIVSKIVTSVKNNPNALVGMSTLYSFDEYTFEHSVNVGVLAVSFGNTIGLGVPELEILGTSGLFHDVGKTHIPPDVLNTPRKLNDAEWALMRAHPENGYKYLCEIEGIAQSVRLAAYEHHERFNGKGYPLGKKNEEISPMARIIAIVDVFDALTAKRVYKKTMLPHKALALIYTMRGADFFSNLVDFFAKSMGIYPAGSLVRLNDRSPAIVYQSNPETPLRPDVLVMHIEGKKVVGATKRILSKLPYLSIEECLDPTISGIDCLDVLKKFTNKQLGA
jgi:HD-GYP domain-containing protein (c-di-GMP phosphodiesterase class II)